jgi:hypothetical protein
MGPRGDSGAIPLQRIDRRLQPGISPPSPSRVEERREAVVKDPDLRGTLGANWRT